MTSPLPPRLRDTIALKNRVRQDRANLKQLAPGFVGGRFPPARPIGSTTIAGDLIDDDDSLDEDTEAVLGWNTDEATAVSDHATVTINLTYLPNEGTLHVRCNGLDLAPDEWAQNDQTITIVESSTLPIREQMRFTAAYLYDTTQEAAEPPTPPTLVFSDTGWDNDEFTFPVGANDGEFILALAVLPPGASISAANGYTQIGGSASVTHAAQSGTYEYRLEAWWIIKPVGSGPVPTLTTVSNDTLTAMLSFAGADEVVGSTFSTVADDDEALSPGITPRSDLRIYATVSNAAILTADQGVDQFNLSGGVDSDVQLMVTSGDFTTRVRAHTDGPTAGWMLGGVTLA